MKSYPARLSIALSLMMPLFILPARLREGQGDNVVNLAGSELVIFLLCLACCGMVFLAIRKAPMPWRWLDLALAGCCCGVFSILFYYAAHPFFEDYPRRPLATMPFPTAILTLFFRGLVIAGIVSPVAWFFEEFRRSQEARLSLEHLKVEHLRARLHSLQQQLNPHFLFNCLNVLGSGAKEEWIKEYARQLSNTYRYLLTFNHGPELVTVEKEILFIRSYIHVLQERFGQGLQVSIVLTPEAGRRFIPPLALQILVENAVKHNVVSQARPLFIRIYDELDLLVVQNNRQHRDPGTETPTSGIGLSNLSERYRLIANRCPSVIRRDDLFTVLLPLLYDPGADIGR